MANLFRCGNGAGGNVKKLLPKVSTTKNSSNAGAYNHLIFDVSELTSISYVASVANSTAIRYAIDGGTNTNLPATEGVLDVSNATTLDILTYASSSTARTFEITDYS